MAGDCHFLNILTGIYSAPRYHSCSGKLVPIEELYKNHYHGSSEAFYILLNSGHLKKYKRSEKWQVCEKHIENFGLECARKFKQFKCVFPGHTGKAMHNQVVSFEMSRTLLEKDIMY